MAAPTDTPVLPPAEWDTEPVILKDFLNDHGVPNVVRVVKGQFMNIGVTRLPLQRMYSDVFLHSIKQGIKVLAHSVKRLETRRGSHQFPIRVTALEQRLSIPISYQGWFELLSEDGKSARPIDSVGELAKRFPEKCLVRQNIKGYLTNDDGKLTLDKTRIIPGGEQLRLSGDITIPLPSSSVKMKFLRCTDSKGDNIYLSFDQKGIFTPIASPDGISGVHTIKDMIKKFRLPLTVKLVQGVWPKVDSNKFTGIVRLDWVYSDQIAFVCPLEKDHLRMLPISTDIPLKMVTAKNFKVIKESEPYKLMMVKCNRMVSNYNNTIHLIISVPETVAKSRNNQTSKTIFSDRSPPRPRSQLKRSKSKEDILFDEIDDLYQYVRFGGAPPKDKFTYDSDEESYWEEPAYEHIDDFRARLNALESGQKVDYPKEYKPTDTKTLNLNTSTEPTVVYSHGGEPNGVEVRGISKTSSSTDPPPPVPPRRYSATDFGPLLKTTPSSSKSNSPKLARAIPKLRRSKSKDTLGSRDSSGSGGNFGKDWRDNSDRSTKSRVSSGPPGHSNVKRRLQSMYL